MPADFHDVLQRYTQEGYRVLALAWRRLKPKLTYAKVQRAQREQLEQQLSLLGLLVLENRLKVQSTPVIRQLQAANIRPVMVTGKLSKSLLSVTALSHWSLDRCGT